MTYRHLWGGVAVTIGALIILSQSVYALPTPLEIGDTFEPLSAEIFETSKAGKQLELIAEPEIVEGEVSSGIIIKIDPSSVNQRQIVEGFGASFTESSAYVLNQLSAEKRSEIIKNFFSPEGNHYSLMRTHIASTDFSKGEYAYVDPWKEDASLSGFSLDEDKDDLLPLIQDALQVEGSDIKILGSAWTAPPWMKDNNEWIRGHLKPEHRETYANYLVKYIQEYKKEGVDIWAITPLNEPSGVGKWNSMEMGGAEQSSIIAADLGPALENAGLGDVRLYAFDQNKDDAPEFMSNLMNEKEWGDPTPYIDGVALHWYHSTIDTYTDSLDLLHERYPDFQLLFTEGTVDELKEAEWGGEDIGEGVGDEAPWFKRDDWWNWWWEKNHSSWGYGADWYEESMGESWQEAQPKVSAVYRYARDIFDNLNHWVVGWIDWNMVLDWEGGPNYAGNTCSAPVMINYDTEEIHYNPQFFLFGHFSKYMRPGGRVIGIPQEDAFYEDHHLKVASAINKDGSIAVALLKDTPGALDYTIEISGKTISGTIDGDAVQTILIKPVAHEIESSSEDSSSDESLLSSEKGIFSSDDTAVSSSEIIESSDSSDENVGESSMANAEDIPNSETSALLTQNSSFNNLSTTMLSSIGRDIKKVIVPASAKTMTIFNVYGEKILERSVHDEHSAAVSTSISSSMLVVVFK